MEISQKAIDEFREIYRKKEGKELSDSEAYEAASNLLGLCKLIVDLGMEEARRKRQLKKEPNGFLLPDKGYSCCICHGASGGERWYNWYGITCNLCRKAITDGIIPAFAAKHRHSWYAAWEFEGKFDLKSPTVRKLVRQGKLIARIVPDEIGGNYEYIFLKKENPEYRDPERYSPVRKSWNRNRNKEVKTA